MGLATSGPQMLPARDPGLSSNTLNQSSSWLHLELTVSLQYLLKSLRDRFADLYAQHS